MAPRRPKVPPVDLTEIQFDNSHLPKIEISYANVLFRPLFYPENQFSKSLCYLMDRISFTKTEVEFLKKMGFPVEIVIRPIELPEDLS